MRRTFATALILALPAVALATELEAPAALRDIPAEDWAAMTSGRTLTYTIDGALWARERYHPGTNRVTLQFFDGSCLEGFWEHDARLYCFHWEDQDASCFRHAVAGDQILVLQTDNGVETGEVQIMSGIANTPLTCGEPPIS